MSQRLLSLPFFPHLTGFSLCQFSVSKVIYCRWQGCLGFLVPWAQSCTQCTGTGFSGEPGSHVINATSSTQSRALAIKQWPTHCYPKRGMSSRCGVSSFLCSLGLDSIEQSSRPHVLLCACRSENKYIQGWLEAVAAQLIYRYYLSV